MNDNDKSLTLLMASFPSSETEQELVSIMGIYDLALEGIDPKWVDQAVRAFIQGRVPGHNPSFRPRPSELAAYARPLQNQQAEFERIYTRQFLQIENRGREEPTAEEKARVQATLKRATQQIAEKVSNDMLKR